MDATTAATTSASENEKNARLTLIAGLLLLAGTIVILSFAPNSYSILLALHVIAAVVWVGGGLCLALLALVAERKKDDEALVAIGKQAEWIGIRIFTPASFVVLGFGIALVVQGPWEWGQFWVLAGLVGWALSAAIGILFLGPESKRLNALAERHGMSHPETQARLKRILAIARFDVVLLVLIVLDMSAKPFL